MKGSYRLCWFDKLIRFHQHLDSREPLNFPDADIATLKEQLRNETLDAQLEITEHVFQQTGEKKITTLVREYHHSIVNLMNLTEDLRTSESHLEQRLREIYDSVMASLTILYEYIELRFNRHLGNARLIPASTFVSYSENINSRTRALSDKLVGIGFSKQLVGIVTSEIYGLLKKSSKGYSISSDQIQYLDLLVSRMENLNAGTVVQERSLDELLVSMNFNSSAYLANFIKRLKQALEQSGGHTGKVLYLQGQLRDLAGIVCVQGVVQMWELPSVKTTIEHWLKEEIDHQDKLAHSLSAPAVKDEFEQQLKNLKVMLALSADQASVILRAAYDTGLFLSKSMRAIFTSFIPYISTPDRADLSPDSTRTKSYDPEVRDKEIAINWLQQLISKIKDY